MNQSILVIKCGGSTMDQLPDSFFETLANLQRDGKQLVIVHGGGPAITSLLGSLQIPAQFIDGMRVTCERTMQVVEMVLGGSINTQLVRRIRQAGGKAWGISGVDGDLLTATKTSKPLGLVGEISSINERLLHTMLQEGYIPVVAPIAAAADGSACYNVNADIAAGAIAAALKAEKLLMVTDVPGILKQDDDGEKRLLKETNAERIEQLIASGEIYGGMIPKVKAALEALGQGVETVVICRGESEDLQAVSMGSEAGTLIKGVGK